MRRELTSCVRSDNSHPAWPADFNNSLAAILRRAQLLRRQIDEPALVRNLDIIQTAAEDAAAA